MNFKNFFFFLLFFLVQQKIYSQSKFQFSVDSGLLLFNKTLEEINEEKPGGVLKFNDNSSNRKIVSIVYKDNWLGIGNYESEFIASPGNKLLQISFRFPKTEKFESLCKKITNVLGPAQSSGKSPSIILSKRYSSWIKGAVAYNLHEYKDSISLFINESKFWAFNVYGLSSRSYTLSQFFGDIIGDKVTRTIYLVGRRFDDSSLFFDKLYFIVEKDQNTVGKKIELPDEFGGGYSAELNLIDFTGDKIPELFISAPTGGSGGIINYFIYSFKNNDAKLLFSPELKFQIDIEGVFLENYKALISINNTKTKHTIDLSSVKSELQNLKTYDETGKLNNEKGIWINPYGLIEAKDIDGDGIKELVGTQAIKGVANYNTIGEVTSTWKWKKNNFVLMNVKVSSIK